MEDIEKILIDIQVNSSDAIKNITDLRDKVGQLKEQQKLLQEEQKKGNITTEEFAKQNEILTQQIKATNKALGDQQRSLQKQVEAAQDAEGSLDQMRKQLASMRKEYNALSKQERESPIGQEMAKNIADLNDELKGAEEQLGDFRRNVGNYQQSVEDALVAQSGLFGQLATATKSAGGVKNLFAGLVSGLKSATVAGLKFIATPIGAAIAAIVGVITLLTQAFKRNEENGQKLSIVFGRIGSVAKTIFKALEPLVGFMVDSFVAAFDSAVKIVEKATSAFANFLDFIGADNAANNVRKTVNAFKEMDEAAQQLAKSEAELTKMQREARKTQLQYQNEAEKLRQLRDDETKSIKERMQLNEQLGALLEKQSQEELAIANKRLEVAKLRIQLDGETTENLDELAEAETEIIDIEERIQGQRSEQLMNLNSLRREQKAQAEERIKQAQEIKKAEEDALKALQDNLSASISTLRGALKQTEASELQDIENKYNELFDLYENLEEPIKMIGESDEEFNKRMGEYKALMLQAADIEVALEEQKQAEIAEIREKYAQKDKDLTDATTEYKKKSAEAEVESEQEKLMRKLAATEEYVNAVNSITSSFAEMANNRDQAALDEYEEANEQKRELLDERLSKGLISQEQYDKQVSTLDSQLESKQKEIALNQAKREKNLAIIQATINTALAIAKAVAQSPMTGGLPGSAIAAAIGAAQIAVISSQPLPKASKGALLKGRSHAMGGIHIEAEGGEAIINKRSTARFRPLLSALNQAGGGVKFAAGGITGQSASPFTSSMRDMGIATADDIRQISEAVRNIKIYTAIKDVNDGQGNFARIVGRANR